MVTGQKANRQFRTALQKYQEDLSEANKENVPPILKRQDATLHTQEEVAPPTQDYEAQDSQHRLGEKAK